MTPQITKRMADKAKNRGAKVTKIQRPAPPTSKIPKPKPQVSTELTKIAALEASITELKQALKDQEIVAYDRTQELTAMLAVLAEERPMRLIPVRDMKRGSDTYLLVTHYDFEPMERVLDS